MRTRIVDAQFCRLRRKLAEAGGNNFLVAHRGVGYQLHRPRAGR